MRHFKVGPKSGEYVVNAEEFWKGWDHIAQLGPMDPWKAFFISRWFRGSLDFSLGAKMCLKSMMEPATGDDEFSVSQMFEETSPPESERVEKEKNPFLCYICGEEGHEAMRCPHLDGYP